MHPSIHRKAGSHAVWTTVALIGLTISSAGCSEASEPGVGSIRFEQRDSADIRIMESSGDALDTVLLWVVDTVPDLQLGPGGGEASQEFHRIRGMTVVQDGNLVVVNAGSHELRWFDGFGDYLFSVGREGAGPAEFRDPILLEQFEADSILVFDGARRLTWVAADGSGHRVQEVAAGARELMAGRALSAQGPTVLFRSGSLMCPRGEFCEPDLLFRWVDVAEATSDTIATLPTGLISTLELGEMPHLLESPFHAVGASTIGPHGPVLEGGTGFELRQFDAGGRLVGILRIDAPPPEAGEEAIDQAVRRWTQQGVDPGPWRRVYAAVDLSEALPAFQSLEVDRAGWLWAERFRLVPDDPSVWVVFDPDGRARGVIEMPKGLEVHEIGEDYVLGSWTDDLGREYVRRHELNRLPVQDP